jgi:ATP-binding protein involved in chromosome partitioning
VNPSDEQVLAALATVTDPELGRPITELSMVRGTVIRAGRVDVAVALPVADHPAAEQLVNDIKGVLRGLGVAQVEVDLTAMNATDRAALRRELHDPEAPIVAGRSRVIAIASGKGGVGKSSLAANLAVAIARRGRRVALLDADVWGFSIPRMMGIHRRPMIIDGLLVPVPAHGVAVASVGLLTEESSPVIWRGPMLHKMLEQFVTDVFWDHPDVLVVDMPPGTGDIALSLSRLLIDAEVVIVTTPQPAAQRVAQRAAFMARQVGLRVIGVIENMSWFVAGDGVSYELFGAGGGEQLAALLEVPLLGQVPLVPAVRDGADRGEPVVVSDPNGVAAQALDAVASQLLALGTTRVRRPELRITQTTPHV